MSTLPALDANKTRGRTATPGAEGQEGIALVVVVMLLLVLSSMGVMTLYSSGVEYNIDVAFKNRGLARNAAEAGVNIVLEKLLSPTMGAIISGDSIPVNDPTSATPLFGPGKTRVHKTIGYCVVLDGNCANVGIDISADANKSENNMCCFRLGPFFDRSTNTLFVPSSKNDTRLAFPGAFLMDVPGTSDYQYLLYNFQVTGGGPGGSAAEFSIGVKKGPVPRRSGSGTMYGSVTGVNLN